MPKTRQVPHGDNALEEIRSKIAHVNKQLTVLHSTPLPLEEEPIEILSAEIAAGAAAFAKSLTNALITADPSNIRHPFFDLIQIARQNWDFFYHAFCFVIKMNSAWRDELLRELRPHFPTDTISAEVNARKRAALLSELEKLEQAEESLCCEIESHGSLVARRAALSPHIFLEFADATKTFKIEKLRKVQRLARSLQREASDIGEERRDCEREIVGMEQEIAMRKENPAALGRIETLQKKIAEQKVRGLELAASLAPVEERRQASNGLLNASCDFLRMKGVTFENRSFGGPVI